MARFAVGLVFGVVVGTIAGAALGLHAADDETVALAVETGLDPGQLAAAAATVGVSPRTYLETTAGEAPSGASSATRAAAPVTGATAVSTRGGVASSPGLTSRVACIEAGESQGRNVANRRGSGAVGVLQYMPSTFAAHAREIGHPEWSPWNPAQARAVAAHDLALGRRGQWTVGGC